MKIKKLKSTQDNKKQYPAGRYGCYLKLIKSKKKCPVESGVEASFCCHPKCLWDNYY